jgi:hypothetical protein
LFTVLKNKKGSFGKKAKLWEKKGVPMSNSNSLAKEPEKSSLTFGLKFKRRSDLTSLSRLKIASEVLCFSCRGTITRLAEQYNISRPFIYDLKSKLEAHTSNIFEAKKVAKPSPD